MSRTQKSFTSSTQDHRAWDFFISYTQDDLAWAEWIAWQLEAEGYSTVLQAWDFRPGENFVVKMRDALEKADRTIAVLSSAYLASRYGTDEWTGAFVHDPNGQRLLPARVEPCQLPRLLTPLVYIDLAGVNRATAKARLLDGVKQGRQRPEQEPDFPGSPIRRTDIGKEPRFPGQLPEIFNLPPPNPSFTGRTSLLTRLGRKLSLGGNAAVVQAQTVHGLGGVGKTQLAIEYAHRHAGDYDLVWWISAEQPAAIPGQLVALARQLGIPEATEQAETIQALWRRLANRDRWLLIFDNAEAPADLLPWWPPGGGGRVLVTSRNPTIGDLTAGTLQVDVLLRREATNFLRRRAGISAEAAKALADALGDLPLALEQATAYLRETGTPVEEYLGLLRNRAPELFTLGQPATTEHTIATTWALALDRVRSKGPVAQDVLSLCAFLAPDAIPRTLLTEHAGMLPERLSGAIKDRIDFQLAIGALRRYSLVAIVGDTLRLHRLVGAVVRHQLPPDEERRWAAAAVRMVGSAFPSDHTNPDVWPTYRRLLPHALVVTDRTQALGLEPEATAQLLGAAGRYLWQRAAYQQARPLLERALAGAEAHLGPNHPTTAWSLDSLALLWRTEAAYEEARRLHERALAIREARLSSEHPATARSLNNLATVLANQGDLDGARTLHERALAIRDASLGPDHPDTAESLNNLARILQEQGHLDDARPMHERALAIREARHSAGHPNIAQSLFNLASLARHQGKLDSALALYQRAQAIYEASLGDHPHTARNLNGLARVLHAQQDLEGARRLHQRALAIREASIGLDHPDTASSLNNLASVLHDQGDLEGALLLQERAVAIFDRRLGVNHPNTLKARRNLSALRGRMPGGKDLIEDSTHSYSV